jgi:hypothetical protein
MIVAGVQNRDVFSDVTSGCKTAVERPGMKSSSTLTTPLPRHRPRIQMETWPLLPPPAQENTTLTGEHYLLFGAASLELSGYEAPVISRGGAAERRVPANPAAVARDHRSFSGS